MESSHGSGLQEQIIERVSSWVNHLIRQLDQISPEQLERQIRAEGREQLASIFEQLLQSSIDRSAMATRCPCGSTMDHAGRRDREWMTSLGPIRLAGVYRRCRRCGHSCHQVDDVAKAWLSEPMQQLVCALGVSMASFAKASRACEKLLGVALSEQTIRRQTQAAGRSLGGQLPDVAPVQPGQRVLGSCDGTMVNTRQDGWRELKAYLFEHHQAGRRVRLSGAALTRADRFCPQLRQAAIAIHAGEADKLFFVADAAAWIEQGVRVQLPTAVRIIDIYHAYQHINDAGRTMFGQGTDRARQWSRTWCEQLRLLGGEQVANRLGRTRWRYPPGTGARAGLEQLLGYLDRHAQHLAYPTFIRRGWPISSGSMESLCKQLGHRLKGCGMRWNTANVTPMARLLTRWLNDQPLHKAA